MFNTVMIVGNLGKDPELHYTPEGKAVTNLSVAVNSGKDRTLWIGVATWDKLAEQCGILHKGDQVIVSGDLSEPYAYIGKTDGQAHAQIEMVARVVRFGKRATTNGQDAPEAAAETDIPF